LFLQKWLFDYGSFSPGPLWPAAALPPSACDAAGLLEISPCG
jgi:hypothetical protein